MMQITKLWSLILSKTAKMGWLALIAAAAAYVISCGQNAGEVEASAKEKVDAEASILPLITPKKTSERDDLRDPNVAVQLSSAMADAVDKALPSVVVIKAGATRLYRERFSYRVFQQQEEVGQGSGVIIRRMATFSPIAMSLSRRKTWKSF